MSTAETIWGHHVGARDGRSALDAAATGPLAASFAVALYEPAVDALEELRQAAPQRTSTTVVLPYGLADRTGRATLYLTYCPFSSSLHEPLRGSFCHDRTTGYDYPLADVHDVVERRDVDVFRLDDVPEIRDGRVGAPDLLFIDTQGSEYEILVGADDVLDGVTAVVAESSYAPLYAGERPFSDVAELLSARGLDFITSVQDMTAQPFRVAIGLRGDDWRVQIDGLFLRRIETVEDDPVALRKLAFAAHYLSQNAFGFECLRRYVARFGADFGATTYGQFLAELVAAAATMPRIGSTDPFSPVDVEPLLTGNDTPIEGVFRRYALEHQAALIKRRRLADVTRAVRARGWTLTEVPA